MPIAGGFAGRFLMDFLGGSHQLVSVSEEFGKAYAGEYDALYGDKDYLAECDAIETLMQRHATGPVRSVLDLGCGTGTHALVLSDRGYAVTGVDRSPAMLDLARTKAAARPGTGAPEFLEGDVRTMRLERTFDAVLMMFAVLGYQTTNEEVEAAFRSVRAHLRPGGVFICDAWFGPAVLSTGPSNRVKVIEEAGGSVTREASGDLDLMRHTCRVEYRLTRRRAGRVVGETVESHTLRYFFPLELEAFSASAGLELRALCPVGNLDSAPGTDSWNVWACARASAH